MEGGKLLTHMLIIENHEIQQNNYRKLSFGLIAKYMFKEIHEKILLSLLKIILFVHCANEKIFILNLKRMKRLIDETVF